MYKVKLTIPDKVVGGFDLRTVYDCLYEDVCKESSITPEYDDDGKHKAIGMPGNTIHVIVEGFIQRDRYAKPKIVKTGLFKRTIEMPAQNLIAAGHIYKMQNYNIYIKAADYELALAAIKGIIDNYFTFGTVAVSFDDIVSYITK